MWPIHEGARRTPLTPFYPRRTRRATKGHEEHLCRVIIWAVHEGRGENTFFIHEGATKKTFAGSHTLWAVHEGRAENTFFIHEGSRRATKNNLLWIHEEPRRAAMGGEEDLLWSAAQIMVAKLENQARNGAILPADVLFLSHFE